MKIKGHLQAPTEFAPDVVAEGEVRCPTCNWWMRLDPSPCRVSALFRCHCGLWFEIYSPSIDGPGRG